MNDLPNLPALFTDMLFCKPSRNHPLFVYEQQLPNGSQFQLRSFKPPTDAAIVYQWNEAQAYHLFQSKCRLLLQDANAHSFTGLLDAALVCRVDLFRAEAAGIGRRLRFQERDCLIDLSFAPEQTSNPSLLTAFLYYYFSFPEAKFLYASPAIHDHKTCRLLEQCGFHFVQNLMLTDKAASIYLISREGFNTLPQI